MDNKVAFTLIVAKQIRFLYSYFFKGITLSGLLVFGFLAHAQTLNLVGNKVDTYIEEHELPARQTDLVYAALSDWLSQNNWQVQITATTQAWSGSGLKSGKFSGYIDHYSLNQEKGDYVYSLPYMKLDLHVISRYRGAENIIRLEQLYEERVGVENRIANTDQLRSERNVRWARVPSFFDNIKQLAEGRVDYLLADKALIDEMNILLSKVGEEPVFISKIPLITVNVSLAMNKAFSKASTVISEFDKGIEKLKSNGQYDTIMRTDLNRESLLDEEIYTDILRKW